MPTSPVNSVIKASSENLIFKGGKSISPPPPRLSYDPKGCGFKQVSENGRQAELQQQETGAAVGEAGR